MNIAQKNIFAGFSIFLLMTGCVLAPAQAQLSEQEQAQRLQDLDQFFEVAKKESALEAARPARWNFDADVEYGYNSNVTLSHTGGSGDFFHQEYLRAIYGGDHDGLFGILGPGQWNLLGEANFRGYQEYDEFDRTKLVLGPSFSTVLVEQFRVDTEYMFKDVIYSLREELSYHAHTTHSQTQISVIPGLRADAFFNTEFRHYMDRNALTPEGSFGDKDREDFLYEIGLGTTKTFRTIQARLEGSWMQNDSNDQREDYNDYESWSLRAILGWQWGSKWLIHVVGAVEARDYDDRLVSSGSNSTQEDELYQAASIVEYSIDKVSSIRGIFSYYASNSNTIVSDYDGVSVSVGYHASF